MECLTEDAILDLAGGAAPPSDAVEAHLARCAECSALVAGALRVRATPRRAWNELVGAQLGPYRIDAQIGEGGMGVVYRAYDPRLARAIAVKVLHDERADVVAEARAAAAIDHRAVVAIHDVGVADGIAYVAMELVDGESLRSAIARGPSPRAHALLVELVDALVAAHARGIVHRDLKPENLIVAKTGLRVLDFGLAQGSGGSVGYMAPEQVRAEPVDARADLFAAGAIAYELATGKRAFPGDTRADRVRATLEDEPPLLPSPLGPIVARCLAKAPADRFQTATDLAWALRAEAPPPARKKPSRRGILVGGLAALGTGALGFLVGRRRTRATATDAPRTLTHKVGRIGSARFTHDASRLLYGAAWDGAPIAIHALDLATSESTALELPAAEILAISERDDLAISIDHRFVDHQSSRGALAVVPLAGRAAPRPYADDVQEADWLGPAELVVVRPDPTGGYRLEHPLGTTLVLEPGWITAPRVSPDRTRVAYHRHPQPNDDAGEVVVLDLATRATRVVSPGWASLAGLAWDPAGDALWFAGSKSDLTTTLQRLDLATTTATVRTVQIANRLRVHDIAADGRLAVTGDAWRLRSIVGETDRSQSDVAYVGDISPDGTRVCIGELGNLDANGAYLVPFDRTDRHTLHLGAGYPISFSPSGTRIAANRDRTDALVVYSTTSGETPEIPTPGFVTYARWLDEESLVALSAHALYKIAIGKQPQPLLSTGAPFALDPARARGAFVGADNKLHIFTLDGKSTTLPGDFAHAEVCGWLATDQIAIRSTTTPIEIDRVDPATGARTHHRTIEPPHLGLKAVDSLILHADGEKVAYSYGEELSQLYVITS